MGLMMRWEPDLTNWHKEGRGVYVSNDGLSRVVKQNRTWIPFIRPSVESEWIESRYVYGALHAAQCECRRMHQA